MTGKKLVYCLLLYQVTTTRITQSVVSDFKEQIFFLTEYSRGYAPNQSSHEKKAPEKKQLGLHGI